MKKNCIFAKNRWNYIEATQFTQVSIVTSQWSDERQAQHNFFFLKVLYTSLFPYHSTSVGEETHMHMQGGLKRATEPKPVS